MRRLRIERGERAADLADAAARTGRGDARDAATMREIDPK
jgi:hypothetical protein